MSDSPAAILYDGYGNPVTVINGALAVFDNATTTSITTSVASNASNVILLAANTGRGGATIFNESMSLLYIKMGTAASLIDYSVQINPNGYFEVPYEYNGEIDGIWSSSDGYARLTELVYG
jgi:hypothetical protein